MAEKALQIGTVCVVLYRSRRAGAQSYLYGVFDTEENARADYFSDLSNETPPDFIMVPLFTVLRAKEIAG